MPVFYRKYRPQKFSEFIGQEEIVKTLTNAISLGLISHAYLFAGPRGSGKTTLARLLAKAINCHKRKENDFEPCNNCSSCFEIQEGRSIDLIEIDAASHRGIDEIRELRDGIKFLPSKEKYKIYILDEAHQLTKEASNALLKTLEEPPSHAIFILATTEPFKILPTISSRCQRFYFQKLRLNEIMKKLEIICRGEQIRIEKEALLLISRKSSGSFRDAETLLEQLFNLFGDEGIKKEMVEGLLGGIEYGLTSQFVDLILKKDAVAPLNFLNENLEKGIDIEEFLKSLINYFRQILIFKLVKDDAPFYFFDLMPEEIEDIKEKAGHFGPENLKKILNLLIDAQNKMKFSPILQLPLELAIIDIVKII